MKNSTFFNKNILNSYLIEAISDVPSLGSEEYEGYISLTDIHFTDINLSSSASFYVVASFYLNSLQTLNVSLVETTFDRIIFNTPEHLFN